jgi:hypothetical protein
MSGWIEALLNGPRSLKRALADLLGEYQRNPTTKLAGTIELLRAEIELRERI